MSVISMKQLLEAGVHSGARVFDKYKVDAMRKTCKKPKYVGEVSAEELIEHIWESDADLFSNSFKVHLHTLKKKLDGAGGAGQYIVTRRGQGYLIKELGEDML